VETLETITMLVGGGHVNAVVTALDWCVVVYSRTCYRQCCYSMTHVLNALD